MSKGGENLNLNFGDVGETGQNLKLPWHCK